MRDALVMRLEPARMNACPDVGLEGLTPLQCQKILTLPGFHDAPEVDVLEHDGQQGVSAPHAAWELGAAAKTEEVVDRALERVRLLRLLECEADVALHDAVEDVRGSGASGAGVGWALSTSRQSSYERFTDWHCV